MSIENMIDKSKLDKLNNLYSQGINPFPNKYNKKHFAGEIVNKFEKKIKPGGRTKTSVSVAGRVLTARVMGKASFFTLQDLSGKIQLFGSKDNVKNYNLLKKLDRGDIIGVKGVVFKTKRGEVTIDIRSFELLTKSLANLPEKWKGLVDQELRYRNRFTDLVSNREVFDFFLARTKFIQNVRKFMDKHDFMEVETPVLEATTGGAEAKPFITKHNTLDVNLFLRISLELHLKRLMVGGFERVYELAKVFRNEGMSSEHLQEFTMLEFYYGYIDYQELMKFVQKFYQTIIKDTFGTLKFKYNKNNLDFGGQWKKVDYVSIVKKETGIDILKENTKEKLLKAIKAKKLKVDVEKFAGRGRVIDQLYKAYVRPKLIQPCFLINHPVVISPLAKKQVDNLELTERFQVLIAGSEVGNGFSELNDPIDQRKRFEEQAKLREGGDEEAQMMDENFVEALELGMPPTSGFGVGIDRLLMILTDQPSVRDVVLFPTMKPRE